MLSVLFPCQSGIREAITVAYTVRTTLALSVIIRVCLYSQAPEHVQRWHAQILAESCAQRLRVQFFSSLNISDDLTVAINILQMYGLMGSLGQNSKPALNRQPGFRRNDS